MVQSISGHLLCTVTGFDLKALHVRFVVDKVALGQVSLPALRVSPAITVPTTLRIYLHFNLFLSGQMGGSWKPSNIALLFRMSPLDRTYFNTVLLSYVNNVC
jgi:hypothetical protein